MLRGQVKNEAELASADWNALLWADHEVCAGKWAINQSVATRLSSRKSWKHTSGYIFLNTGFLKPITEGLGLKRAGGFFRASAVPPAVLETPAPAAGGAVAVFVGEVGAAEATLLSLVRGTFTPKLALGSSGTFDGSTLALFM